MVGEREAALDDLLHRVEEVLKSSRVAVGVGVAELPVHLRERGRAERHLALGEVHEDEERAFALRVGLEVRREGEPHVLDGREAGYDERERGDLLVLNAL